MKESKKVIIELTTEEAEQFLEEYKHLKNNDKYTIIQYISAFIKIELKQKKQKEEV